MKLLVFKCPQPVRVPPADTEVEKMGEADASNRDKKFLEFDWSDSEEWQLYLSNLYPLPPASKILKWKKKWYKQNVDADFDVDSSVGEPQASAATSSQQQSSSSPSAASTNPNTSTSIPPQYATAYGSSGSPTARRFAAGLRLAALLMSIAYVFPTSSRRIFNYAVWLHIAANATAIVGKFGFPKLDIAWAQPVVIDDFALALFFSLTAFSFNGNWMALSSPSLSALMGLADAYPSIIQPLIPPFIEQNMMLAKGARQVNLHRYHIMQFRANCEVMLGVITSILALLGRSSFWTVLLYWNALRSAYQVSGFTRTTFSRLNATITNFLASGFVPPAVLSTYNKLSGYLYKYAAAESQGY